MRTWTDLSRRQRLVAVGVLTLVNLLWVSLFATVVARFTGAALISWAGFLSAFGAMTVVIWQRVDDLTDGNRTTILKATNRTLLVAGGLCLAVAVIAVILGRS